MFPEVDLDLDLFFFIKIWQNETEMNFRYEDLSSKVVEE